MIDPNKVISDCEQADHIMQDQRAEIDRLKEAIRRLADQDATLSLLCKRDGSCVVTVTMDDTLTDAEREAIAWCVDMAETTATECDEELAALRGLLERMR
jgi:hypothetical protein